MTELIAIYVIGCRISYKYLKRFVKKFVGIDLQYKDFETYVAIFSSWLGVISTTLSYVLINHITKNDKI